MRVAKIRRAVTAIGVVACSFAVMTLPVGAVNTNFGGVGVSFTIGSGIVVTGSGQWEGANVGGGTTVTFECQVTAPGAVSVTIDYCYIVPGPQYAILSPVSAPGEALSTASNSTCPVPLL